MNLSINTKRNLVLVPFGILTVELILTGINQSILKMFNVGFDTKIFMIPLIWYLLIPNVFIIYKIWKKGIVM